MICPLSRTEFSTRSAQLHLNPMGMPGVLPKVTGAKEGKRVGGLARIEAMAGTSVESLEITEKSHTTAPMVRCPICKKHTCFLHSYLNGPIL